MSRSLLYVIGPPGVGKTTMVTTALRDLIGVAREEPIPHIQYWLDGSNTGIQLGVSRSKFSGTDGLRMNIQPTAEAFLELIQMPVVAEGDRLGNDRFFEHAKEFGWDLDLILLDAPEGICDIRRKKRGSHQSKQWIRGRVTKVQRLADAWDATRLSGLDTVESLSEQLRARPALREMRGEPAR